jgi:hypothetical protein
VGAVSAAQKGAPTDAGAASQKKLESRWQSGEANPETEVDNDEEHAKMDTIFANIKKVLPGLDLLSKKVVAQGDIDKVNLRQERGEGIPAKTGNSFVQMATRAFTNSLLTKGSSLGSNTRLSRHRWTTWRRCIANTAPRRRGSPERRSVHYKSYKTITSP